MNITLTNMALLTAPDKKNSTVPAFKPALKTLNRDTVQFGMKLPKLKDHVFTDEEVSKLMKDRYLDMVVSLLQDKEITTQQIQSGLDQHREKLSNGSVKFYEDIIKHPEKLD